MDAFMTLFITMAVFVAFDIVALRWGADSRDAIDSKEWERRKLWTNRLATSYRPVAPVYTAGIQQRVSRMNGHAPVMPQRVL